MTNVYFIYPRSPVTFRGGGKVTAAHLLTAGTSLAPASASTERFQTQTCGWSLETIIWRIKYFANLITLHWKHSFFLFNESLKIQI